MGIGAVITVIVTAAKSFWAGITAARKAKAGAEIQAGQAEVKAAQDNVSAVEAELK
jgi:hypothetical protein